MARSTVLTLHASVSGHRLRLVVARLLGAELISAPPDSLSVPEETVGGVGLGYRTVLSPRDTKNFVYEAMPGLESDVSFVMFRAEHTPGQIQQWYFHREAEVPGTQLWTGYTNPLVLAVGERLARFFGGHLVWDDSRENDPPFRVGFRQAAFPPPSRGQTPAQRVEQFEAALADLRPLAAAELGQAMDRDRADRTTSPFAPLYGRLLAQERACSLSDALAPGDSRRARCRF